MLRRLGLQVILFSIIGVSAVQPSVDQRASDGSKMSHVLHSTAALRSSEEQAAHQYYMATGRLPHWLMLRDRAEEDGRMHVVYALEASSAVLKAALVSMATLSRHVKEPHLCTIHVIGDDVDTIDKELVSCFFDLMGNQVLPQIQLHDLHEMPDVMLQYASQTLRPDGDVTADTFLRRAKLQMSRFYVHQYLPRSASRALWLEAETLVLADIKPLFELSMKNPVAAVKDAAGLEDEVLFLQQAAANFPEAQGFIPTPDAHHFKTSVLLMDLTQWRQRQLHQDLEALAGLVRDHRTVDQLLLNLGLHSQFDVLDSTWNVDCSDLDLPVADGLKHALIVDCRWTPEGYKNEKISRVWKMYDENGRCIQGKGGKRTSITSEIRASGTIVRSE